MSFFESIKSFLKPTGKKAEHNQPPPSDHIHARGVVNNGPVCHRSHAIIKGDRLRRMNVQGFSGRTLV